MRERALTIGLLYDLESAYDVKVLAGVAAYLRDHAHLSVRLDGVGPGRHRASHGHAGVSGFIADLNHPEIARFISTSHVPVVAFGAAGGRRADGIPIVCAHNSRIAALAADHLAAAGVAHFAYCGYHEGVSTIWSLQRERAFAQRLADGGRSVFVTRVPASAPVEDGVPDHRLAAWLQTLPKPVGIMAANDVLGRRLLQACRTAGVRVPVDAAVIGVDNDDVLCELSSPQLSSIEQGARQVGYAAASLLDRMLAGEAPSLHPHAIEPHAVVVRRSSRAAAAPDPDVAAALAFIEDRLDDDIGVADVVRAAGAPRARLEARFRAVMRCSIAAAIRDARLRRARERIAQTGEPLKQVAAATGFSSVQHMTAAFAKAFGHTPAAYRRSVNVRQESVKLRD